MSIRTEEKAAERWADDGGSTPKSPDLYVAKTFQIPDLKGISRKNINEHLELYAGYVKFSNHIMNRIKELPKDEEHSYELSLLQRRFAYEHDGMKHHEVFFEQFEGGPGACAPDGPFLKQVTEDFGSVEQLVDCLKGVAMTRGTGWAMLYYCRNAGRLIPQWVDEHHIGLLSGPKLIFALDMWEHAFVYDFATSEKKKYVEAFFENLNWIKVEARFGK
jgi:superoxide dismutase, Fe-Mn family